MKKIYFLIIPIIAVMACTEQKATDEDYTVVIKEPNRDSLWSVENEKNHYIEDVRLAESYKNTSEKNFSEIYFVKMWNTPDYFAHNESFTGCAWDGNVFLGKKIEDKVYYIDQHKPSKKYQEETGDSIIFVEKFFPADGVTTDPRQTTWWLSSIQSPRTSDIDTFIMEATLIRDNKKAVFINYKENLKASILKCPGSDNWKKIIEFTAQTVKGKPESWNAWVWPGYYREKKKVEQNTKI